MNTDIKNYEISYDWGDPRNRHYKNGLIVFNAIYREADLSVYFKAFASVVGSQNEVTWILEAPKNLREALGKRWADRSVVFDRVKKFLVEQDNSYNFRIQENMFSEPFEGSPFLSVKFDTSKVKGWIPTMVDIWRPKLILIEFTLPTLQTLVPITIGYLLAYFGERTEFHWLSESNLQIGIIFSGIISIIFLIKDMIRNYEPIKMVFSLNFLATKDVNWRLKSLLNLLKLFGRRYVLTLALAVHLIYLG